MPESRALGNVRPDLFVVTTVYSDEGEAVLRLRVRQKRRVMISVPFETWMVRLRCGRCRMTFRRSSGGRGTTAQRVLTMYSTIYGNMYGNVTLGNSWVD